MKALFLISLMTLMSSISFSQSNWEMKSLSIQTGETSFTTGLSVNSILSKQNSTLILDFNSDLGEIIYLYSPVSELSFGPSVGFFNNTLWGGPIAELSLFNKVLKNMVWFGWSFGDTEKGSTSKDAMFCFAYQETSLNFKNTSVYYALMKYQKERTDPMYGIRQNFEINQKWLLNTSLGYIHLKRKPLYSIALTYNL